MSITQQNATSFQNTTAMQSFFEVAKPQISNIIFYNRKYILPMNVFKTMGLMREIKGEMAEHFEAGWLQPNVHAAANATAGGAGQTLTFTVSANDVTNGNIYPRETNVVLFKNSTSGIVTDVTGTSVTVTPLDPTYTLSVTAGDALWIIANAQVEGSSPMAPADTGRELLQYPLQIIRENWSGTGSAVTNELWFDKDQFGNMRDTYSSGYFDAEFRFWEQVGNSAIWNPYNNNTGSVPQSMMYSMNYVADTQGNTTQYVGGNFGINEFKEMKRYAAKQASGSHFMFMVAPDLYDSIQTGASDVLAQNPNVLANAGSTTFSTLFTAGYENYAKQLGIDIQFSHVNFAGHLFEIVPVGQWGLDVTGGAAGFKQSGYGFAIPLTKSADAAGTLRDRFCMTYKKNFKWNRAFLAVETGMLASTPTNGVDEVNINMLGQWGTEYFGAQNIQRVKPA